MKSLVRMMTVAAVATMMLGVAGPANAGGRDRGDIDFKDGVFYVTGTTGYDRLYYRLVDDEIEVTLKSYSRGSRGRLVLNDEIDKDKKRRKVRRIVFETNGGSDRVLRLPGTPRLPVRVIRPPR